MSLGCKEKLLVCVMHDMKLKDSLRLTQIIMEDSFYVRIVASREASFIIAKIMMMS